MPDHRSFDAQSMTANANRRTGQSVQFDSVSKDYHAGGGGLGAPAVENVNLSIDAGTFYCLLGPSGCGKTTLLNMLAGFERPTRGRVLLDGDVIRGPGRDRGVVFQSDECLLPWASALKNVMFGLRLAGINKAEAESAARRTLALVGLSGAEAKRPSQLSGGMRQRVQIARVLVNEPSVLCVDEPFAALDAQTRSKLQDELVTVWRSTGQTVLFITHDIIEALLLADRIGIMSHGPRSGIRREIAIDAPRPRHRTDASLLEHYDDIVDLLAG